MTISAVIIEDSYYMNGDKKERVTTFVLRYHRYIHSELMTHRDFSRNASSSRAIPVEKSIASVMDDPAIPVHWGKNQKGMQAEQEVDGATALFAKSAWLEARDNAVASVKKMIELGIHKQIANRLLEPFNHISVVVTANRFANWFRLRCHKDAQPEIKELADLMLERYNKSEPKLLGPGEWHLPFVGADERKSVDDIGRLIKYSVARCARVSYLTHSQEFPDKEADYKLFDRLMGSEVVHASPTEHQASPCPDSFNSKLWGNLPGWMQYRKTIANENATTFEGIK